MICETQEARFCIGTRLSSQLIILLHHKLQLYFMQTKYLNPSQLLFKIDQIQAISLYNKMRTIVQYTKHVGLFMKSQTLLNTSLAYRFSTQHEKHTQTYLNYEDWEYCKKISLELKSSKVTTALNLLFQSYFNEKVLDIQIYNSVLHALQETNINITYSEIVYLLYREHFPPHPLLANSMNKLSSTKNQKLLSLLKDDFQSINVAFPVQKKSRRESRSQKLNGARQVENQSKKQVQKQTYRKINSTPLSKVLQDPIKPISIDLKDLLGQEGQIDPQKMNVQQLIKLKLSAQLKHTLQQINSELSFSKINLFDVQIEMNQPQREEIDHQQEFQYDQDDMDVGPGIGFLQHLDISKIKIGRVQFVSNNPSDKDQN